MTRCTQIFVSFVIFSFGTLNSTSAQTYIPAGCFVTDEVRGLYIIPPTCYNEERYSVAPYTPDDGFTDQQLFDLYGFQVGLLVYYSWQTYYKWQAAETNSNTHYGWYSAEFDKNKQLKAMEKKLRKACGSKCRKIVTIASLSANKTLRQPAGSEKAEGRPFLENFLNHSAK